MPRSFRTRDVPVAFTLIELLVVMGITAVLLAVLLPALSRARLAASKAQMRAQNRAAEQLVQAVSAPQEEKPPAATAPQVARAIVNSFDATVALTPRLSVGTAEPESIYGAAFHASLEVKRDPAQPQQQEQSQIELPLPPQVISLGDVSVLVNGVPSDTLSIAGDKLVWSGKLAGDVAAKLDVTYTAIGKGLYSLQTPPGSILDRFKIEMTAQGSDVRMLELSLQPTSYQRGGGVTKYVWDYKRLMFGRPIALDVLGVAPIDRLGELRWLGPLSVVAFGAVIGLVSRAYGVPNFDRWMLLLVLGLFTGAYPLMYFAQEFIPLRWATVLVGALVLFVISARASSLMGRRLGVFGVTLPAALIMTLTVVAATRPNLQGILLTGLALGLFMLGMLMAPKLQMRSELPIGAVPAV